MKPFYQDDRATIYNCSATIFESDVIVLDPPGLLYGSNIFKANVFYIFCGKQAPFYEAQFPDRRVSRVGWQFTVPDSEGFVREVHTDVVLVVGNVKVPGMAVYHLEPIQNRTNRWERPIDFMMNLLAESEGSVLDPFMGSGATLIAAKRQGRDSIGFEIDEMLCKIAAERLSKI